MSSRRLMMAAGALMAAVIAAIAASVSVAARPDAQATAATKWVPFQWLAATASGHRLERAALLVDATIAGLPGRHRLQLDTGAHASFLHGGAVADVDAAYARGLGGHPQLAGEIAGVAVTREPFSVIDGYRAIFTPGTPTPVIGTLGLPFLQHGTIVLDYPRRRLAMLEPGTSLPRAIEQAAAFLPIEHRNGKVYVPVDVQGTRHHQFFFDTGASIFPLAVSQADWQRMTQRAPHDSRNQRLTVPSWNNTFFEMVGAPLNGTIRVGPVSRRAPLVFFVNDARFTFDALPGTQGLLGNALFADEFVVILDLPGRRIGFAKSAALRP
jgi:hypothetical protein